MKDLIRKYDKFLKGKKTYILLAVMSVLALYGNSKGIDLDGLSSWLDTALKLLTDRINQIILLIAAIKAFNRASQETSK